MADFRKALETILEHEGGLVDHPDDPGGVTNFGISLRYALQVGDQDGDGFADLDIDLDGDVDADDIRNLSVDDAAERYRLDFWEPLRCYEIANQAVATKLCDTGVNVGKRQAVLFIQRAAIACGKQITDDGILGPNTLHAIETSPAAALLAGMRSEQAGFYRLLIARGKAVREYDSTLPDFSKFERGWMRRAYS